MKKKHRGLLFVLSTLLFATTALAHPKATRELLQKFWPDAQSAVEREITLSATQKATIAKALGKPLPKEFGHTDAFVVVGTAGSLGVLLNFDPPQIGMGVAVDRERQKVVKVAIYKQRGGIRLDTPAFLDQFAGKTATQPFTVGKDIKPVKGAEKESQVIATDVKAALLLAQQGF